MIYRNITQLIGKTPLVALENIQKELRLKARLLAKIEYFNPSGSVKDRAAYSMLAEAEKRGAVKAGTVVIEPTSGNTGIGLAAICAVRGYRLILTARNDERGATQTFKSVRRGDRADRGRQGHARRD